MAGTSIQVDVWIMLEYRRAWQSKALANNTLLDATNLWLKNTVEAFAQEGLVARPQFIRRPERTDTMQLFVARDGRLGGVAVTHETELHALDLLSTPLPEVLGTHYFVCTNAKRDVCCAKFGRPAFAALHQKVPGRAWQTTHVGGHRYAPNVLTLPQSAMYGRVMANDVAQLLHATEQQKVAWEFLRGRTQYPKVVQAAEATLIANALENGIDPLTLDDYKLIRWTDASAVFATPDGLREVKVQPASEGISLPPSCGKPTELVYPLQGHLTD